MHTVMATSRGWWKSLFILPWLSFFSKNFFFEIVSPVNWKKRKNKQNIFTEWCCPWKLWCWKHLPQNGCDTFAGDKRDLTQQDGNSATEWRKNILHSRSCATFFRHSAVLILLAVLLCKFPLCTFEWWWRASTLLWAFIAQIFQRSWRGPYSHKRRLAPNATTEEFYCLYFPSKN